MGKVIVVGIGPGDFENMTIRAHRALESCDTIIGYHVYVDLVRDTYPGKEFLTTPMTRETARCQMALEEARKGKTVAMVCSGDSGIYGMAALIYEIRGEEATPEVEVIPGLTAACSGAALLGAGVLLMIEKKQSAAGSTSRAYLPYAVGAAVFAALTSILAKIGISGVESNLGTAIRTVVVLIMAWGIVLMKGKHAQVRNVDHRELLFIALSGVATGASWLCYYYAIQTGVVSVVVPIDKLSILVSIAFSRAVFGERLNRRAAFGHLLMVAGTLAMTLFA